MLGFTLLWAGLDKVLGLGFPTEKSQVIIKGASATEGYLTYGIQNGSPADGNLTPFAGNLVLDIFYLLVTLGAGTALILGIIVKLSSLGAAALFAGLWFSSLPLEYNPIIDQHLMYAVLAFALASLSAGRHLGLGSWWESLPFVKDNRWLA